MCLFEKKIPTLSTFKGTFSEGQAFIFKVILDKSNDRWSSLEPDSNEQIEWENLWIAKYDEHWTLSEVFLTQINISAQQEQSTK